ncbi:MAG: hypothetical protein FJZ04_02185 [Candidatus Moranbacteria bacterium]|nr:hypothetical protein [Candidatus Moranbacteria bacterium]
MTIDQKIGQKQLADDLNKSEEKNLNELGAVEEYIQNNKKIYLPYEKIKSEELNNFVANYKGNYFYYPWMSLLEYDEEGRAIKDTVFYIDKDSNLVQVIFDFKVLGLNSKDELEKKLSGLGFNILKDASEKEKAAIRSIINEGSIYQNTEANKEKDKQRVSEEEQDKFIDKNIAGFQF